MDARALSRRCTWSNSTESVIVDPPPASVHGPTTLRSRCVPESTDPSDTIESIALPMRPTESRTNFAGGEFTACEWIGHSML